MAIYNRKNILLFILVCLLVIWVCQVLFYLLTPHETLYCMRLPSGALFLVEDPEHPQLRKWKEDQKLEDKIRSQQTDLEKLSILAQWTSTLFKPSLPFPHYPPWNANIILKMIQEKKTGGFCAQYALIFGQSCQSLGYPIRYIDLADKTGQSTHFTVEVYVPNKRKWVAFEPQEGFYWTGAGGEPLSALELREYLFSHQSEKVRGYPPIQPKTKDRINLYFHYCYYLRNNFLSIPVFVRKIKYPGTTKWLFEFYRMFYDDGSLEKLKEHNPEAFVSSRKEDFDFNFSMQEFIRKDCRSLADFDNLILTLPILKVAQIKIPTNMLEKLVKERCLNNSFFKPYARAIE